MELLAAEISRAKMRLQSSMLMSFIGRSKRWPWNALESSLSLLSTSLIWAMSWMRTEAHLKRKVELAPRQNVCGGTRRKQTDQEPTGGACKKAIVNRTSRPSASRQSCLHTSGSCNSVTVTVTVTYNDTETHTHKAVSNVAHSEQQHVCEAIFCKERHRDDGAVHECINFTGSAFAFAVRQIIARKFSYSVTPTQSQSQSASSYKRNGSPL